VRDLETTLASMPRAVSDADGEWIVRSVRGGAAKSYRCPGCDQLIPPGTAHLVVWPADDLLGAEHGLGSRRHWHAVCWQARHRRSPTRRR